MRFIRCGLSLLTTGSAARTHRASRKSPVVSAASRTAAASSTAGSMSKRAMVKIGTHNGAFHCDEAFGCFLLRQTEEFKDADIVRTRDAEKLKDLDVVLDVGGIYDAEARRFDHHQRGFEEVFGHGFSTKLSSAGLVYKHYGQEIVANMLGLPLTDPNVMKVYLKVYKGFVEGLDAIDNGISQYDTDAPPRYTNSTHLSARVGGLNPRWNQENTEEIAMQQFLKAVQLTGSEFSESVDYYGNSWLPARKYVEDAVTGRLEIDGSGEIIVLERNCPWKEHLYSLEEELKVETPIKYCLYPEPGDKGWRVQCVSTSSSSFENRKSLPWKGLRDDALSEASGIAGGVFVHMAGFIGGNKTYEGAVAMAKKALTIET